MQGQRWSVMHIYVDKVYLMRNADLHLLGREVTLQSPGCGCQYMWSQLRRHLHSLLLVAASGRLKTCCTVRGGEQRQSRKVARILISNSS